MSKVKELKGSKITEEQLKTLQESVNAINQIHVALGQLEGEKFRILNQLPEAESTMQAFQKALEEEYGKVTVNIQDGTIKGLDGDNS